jgi:hypothetical protein
MPIGLEQQLVTENADLATVRRKQNATKGESDLVRSYFFASGCQFLMSVIGAVALSSSGLMKKPSCR